MATKAIIYCRYSPRPDAEHCESIEWQTAKCEEYAQERGYQVKGVFFDKAVSGGDADRPGLLDAMDNLRRGWILLVYRLDRLARDVWLSELWQHRINMKIGARVEAITGGGNEQDPSGRFLRHMLQAVDEFHRQIAAQRTSQAMKHHMQKGRIMCNPAQLPYGWQLNPRDSTRMIPEPFERANIDIIIRLRHQGLGFRAICRELQNRGILRRDRKIWRHQMIKRILEREGLE